MDSVTGSDIGKNASSTLKSTSSAGPKRPFKAHSSFLGSEKPEINPGAQRAASFDSRGTTISLDPEAVPQAMRA